MAHFKEFSEESRDTYPAMISSWENSREEFAPFLECPLKLRKIAHTTNSTESLNAPFRRAVRPAGISRTNTATKVLYLGDTTTRRRNRQT